MLKIKHKLLIIILLIANLSLHAQDTVKVDNNNFSDYEKVKSIKNSFVSEDIIEIWEYKNLKLEKAILKNSSGTILAKAIRFNANNADGKIKLIQDREYRYLDINEIDSLIFALERFVKLKSEKPYENEQTLTYVSKGDIYAGCYMKRNRWRCIITIEPGRLFLSTNFKKDGLEEMINVLKINNE